MVAEVDPYPYVDPDRCSMPRMPSWWPSTRSRTPQPGRGVPLGGGGGAAGLVIPSRRSAAVTAVACKASAGAVEHLPVARVPNLADWLGGAKEAGAWIYGAGRGGPAPYAQADLSGKVVLVLGSEGRGLRRRISETCDLVISIPVRGGSAR